ncbi:bifunctional 4-hydroxy-2-oxoglutarate aldolase/2-dehydro-3-deoxy-phosphogluconate aldolase [Halalkalibacter alkaliphilus]|uniref:Bifunctional 4-hydroxy-2-oxoglutarate aldolase/2-dehydro-3-deoxy-phosphogluconate aldolase n=1 Tax=Halalkalibacter alkaliphilus TaxID=2917993 RepID=A0A9X2CR52_9BACI|nr:bifunctional 4-hydroxy-2-oxoglutarate aldolase/2-dehydro-3-deoxy-phosphogluconate aldolase [Halalkalibacter alkaliphilus]MCL7746816.1 bifunctional 4-hydroxy-2-oxoglutarate aldolase/2-dehydro-3-deoxy-phosphogluconate aldolase [Halalkalibacter alkaliphilus]
MSEAIQKIIDEKLIAIIRIEDTNSIEQVVTSLYKGGIQIVEVTMNTPGALEAIGRIKSLFPDLLVGAGTVLDSETAQSAISAGANFLLSPTLDKATIRTGNRYGVPVIPGVMTPTEALKAYEYGAQMVKVFPVRSLDPCFAKDLLVPLPFLKLMAVGGISESNTEDYLNSGWHAVGIGGQLVNAQLIRDRDFVEIEKRARRFVERKNNTCSFKGGE